MSAHSLCSGKGRRDHFIDDYRNERRQQLRLAIKPPTKVDDTQEFKRYFFQIIGFSVVEDTILHTYQSSSGGHKDEAALSTECIIVQFMPKVLGYGFNNDKLYEVALEIREHYDELLMKTKADAFKNLLAVDDYTPVTVETDQHFQGIMEMFNYKDLQIHNEPFPKKLPFSLWLYRYMNKLNLS
uniref:Exocyst complex subunit EXOC6/Sec15 C-terminal domain-containing protein n=1 Tax=Amphimedon queenslandica TaxID=400682 RepID=A0A1X7T998_AMPQE